MISVINGNFLSFKRQGIVFVPTKPAKTSLKENEKRVI